MGENRKLFYKWYLRSYKLRFFVKSIPIFTPFLHQLFEWWELLITIRISRLNNLDNFENLIGKDFQKSFTGEKVENRMNWLVSRDMYFLSTSIFLFLLCCSSRWVHNFKIYLSQRLRDSFCGVWDFVRGITLWILQFFPGFLRFFSRCPSEIFWDFWIVFGILG